MWSLQDFGALGELIGGVAVVLSVIYLTIQVRHGIKGYKSQSIISATNHFSNLQLEIARDDGLLTAMMKAERHEPLTELEQRRVLNIASSYLIGFENIYSQVQNDMLDSDAYESRRRIVGSILRLKGVRDWWDQMGRNQFPDDFASDVEQAEKDYA